MSTNVLSHLIQQISTTTINSDPFLHFYIEQIFPESYYRELLENLPDVSYFDKLEHYPERHSFEFDMHLEKLPFAHFLFWKQFYTYLSSNELAYALLKKFEPQLVVRFGENYSKTKLGVHLSLVRDQSNYSIGPHTDHPNKVLSLLFYLPDSLDQKHLGTALYLPKDRTFKCDGHMHHSFEYFDKIQKVSFLPNSLFGFLKSDNSFHGVEPIGKQEKERILIAYNILEQP